MNSDAVGCSPLFEIRESQNPTAPINQFGNGQPNAQSTAAHTPPFHLSNVTKINLETQNAPFVPSQAGVRLPPTGVTVPSNGFPLPDANEMDLSPDNPSTDQPSPATTTNSRSQSQSNGGSGSHSSYSPAQPNENLPYRPSPRLATQMPLPHSSANPVNHIFPYSSAADMFNANMYANPAIGGGDALGGEFGMGMGAEWELGGMGAGAAMTPMSDGTWNQMLENMIPGLDYMGTPHGNPSGR